MKGLERAHSSASCFKQQGAALILFAVLLFLVTTAAFFTYFDSSQYKVERERRTLEALVDAKTALIGWSVAHPQYLGILPFPDRSIDGDYDGNSDCVSAAMLEYPHLLGKFPHVAQTAPCVGTAIGIASDAIDGYGERLWYAVSRNLIRTSVVTGSLVINPGVADAPTYPWLIVRDKQGQIISSRVAAVIIAPGPPVGAQNRTGGLAGPAAYLDTVTIAGNTYSNADSTVPYEDFIMAEDMQRVSPVHPTYQQPYEFNDRLIYITIDELLKALESRVIREAANALRTYYTASAAVAENRFFPYASVLGDTDNLCEEAQLQGGLPISNIASSCTHSNPGLSTLPAWFVESRWQDYLYYAISPDCTFATPGCAIGGVTVGSQINQHALLISAGVPLAGQVRPSNNIADYLDSAENANGDNVFDAVGSPVTAIYNDRMLIVAP
jgi:hypothetical protein